MLVFKDFFCLGDLEWDFDFLFIGDFDREWDLERDCFGFEFDLERDGDLEGDFFLRGFLDREWLFCFFGDLEIFRRDLRGEWERDFDRRFRGDRERDRRFLLKIKNYV